MVVALIRIVYAKLEGVRPRVRSARCERGSDYADEITGSKGLFTRKQASCG